MIKIAGEYKGYAINWTDFGKFSIIKEGVEVRSELISAEACENWIDKQEKTVFKRVPVLVEYIRYGVRNPSQSYIHAEATSVMPDGDVWITNGKDRSKTRTDRIYTDTPTNRAIIDGILVSEYKLVALNAEIKADKERLERLTPEMMIVKT